MNDDMPLVSVVMPIYNVEKYLPECLDSVINQTYKNLEIILVDDGSPDNCGKICDEYAEKDSRIKVIHKANGGVSSARNAGIEAATGDWIYFIDPDDCIEHDTIGSVLKYVIKNKCDMCIFDFDIVYSKKIVEFDSLKYESSVFVDLNNNELFLEYSCRSLSVWNIFTKASVIKKIRFDTDVQIGEDEIFRFQLYGKISSLCYLKKALYHYCYRTTSATNTNLLQPYMINYNKNLKKYQKKCSLTKQGNYPSNVFTVLHTVYLMGFLDRCYELFGSEVSWKEKKSMYSRFVTSPEFLESIVDIDNKYYSPALKICLKWKKAPHWLFVYLLVKIRGLRNVLIKKGFKRKE